MEIQKIPEMLYERADPELFKGKGKDKYVYRLLMETPMNFKELHYLCAKPRIGQKRNKAVKDILKLLNINYESSYTLNNLPDYKTNLTIPKLKELIAKKKILVDDIEDPNFVVLKAKNYMDFVSAKDSDISVGIYKLVKNSINDTLFLTTLDEIPVKYKDMAFGSGYKDLDVYILEGICRGGGYHDICKLNLNFMLKAVKFMHKMADKE